MIIDSRGRDVVSGDEGTTASSPPAATIATTAGNGSDTLDFSESVRGVDVDLALGPRRDSARTTVTSTENVVGTDSSTS